VVRLHVVHTCLRSCRTSSVYLNTQYVLTTYLSGFSWGSETNPCGRVEEILLRQDTFLQTLSLKKKKRRYAFVIHVIADRMSLWRHVQSHRKRGFIVPSCIILPKRLSLRHTWCEQKEGFNLLSHTLSPKTKKKKKHVSENKGSKFSEFPQPI
jgi:hypothetical protein